MMKIKSSMEMDLKNREWGEFQIRKLFCVTGSKTTSSNQLKKIGTGNIPYVTTRATNNGIDGFYQISTERGNVLTVDSAVLGYCSYQSRTFSASDHVEKLIPKFELNKFIALFFQMSINQNQYKFSYGYKASQSRLRVTKILLPINSEGNPDYFYMEAYMRQKEEKKIREYETYVTNKLKELKDYKEVEELKDKKWGEFFLEKLFKINSTSSGIDKIKLIKKSGDFPYITRSEKKNGYDLFICEQDKKYSVDKENVITIGLDTQTVFYQSNKFYTGQNIQVLFSEELNKYNAQFLISLIKRQMRKFNWNYGATLTRLRRIKILLPITADGDPDYFYMENYAKRLEYQKLKMYLDKKNRILI